MTLKDDLDLGTTRCVSMRCAFIPNMSLVTESVSMSKRKMLCFYIKFAQTNSYTDNGKTIRPLSFDAEA